MPPARTPYTKTAAASKDQGSGCLFSFALIPPLAVIMISALLASFAWRRDPLAGIPPIPTQFPSTQTLTDIPPTDLAETRVAETLILSPTIPVVEARIVPSTDTAVEARIDISAAASMGSLKDVPRSISPVFTAEVQHWGQDIARWAAVSHVDPDLAATVMQIESCGDPRATSASGAIGLFQVMPFHFFVTDFPYNPETNAARGLAYLFRSMEAARGDARLALAGYNGGIGVIERLEWTWSAQTKRYVQYGWPIYQDAHSGASSSSAVDEWYSRYGASLCRQAHQRMGLP